MKHISLYVEGVKLGGTQPVEVEELETGKFRILYSPGFVEGIAAEDLIQVTDEKFGYFKILERGGNIAIKWGAPSELGKTLSVADNLLSNIGARRDGAISNAAVWTVPASVGFNVIETQMEKVIALLPESSWWYGNVYDDNGNPLNWW